MIEPLIDCRDVWKSWGRKQVLRGCTFSVAAGELAGLVGENGSGKTTLLRCILGFTRPTRGEVQLGGPVGYCPQETSLHNTFTVREHLDLSRLIYGIHTSVDSARAAKLLDQFRLTPALDDLMGVVSGGTRQKVKFLTAILHSPRLLLMDEPYDGFDWQTYLLFWEVVREMRDAGAAVLLVTHFVHDRQFLDKVFEIREGQLHAS